MKLKYVTLWAIALCLMSLCSCASDEDKALQTVKDFTQAVNTYNTAKQRELYPNSHSLGEGCLQNNLNFDNATVEKIGENFIVSKSKDCFFEVTKKGEQFIITDSKKILKGSDFVEGVLTDIAVATGLTKGRGAETDVVWLKNTRSLMGNSEFLEFLKNKYSDALTGYMKTLSVKHKPVMSIYRVDVLFESGGNEGVDVTATVYNKDGKRVGQRTRSVGPTAKGDRESVLLTFKTDAVSPVGRIDVTYAPQGYSEDVELLRRFAPLSKGDYQEFLNSKQH